MVGYNVANGSAAAGSTTFSVGVATGTGSPQAPAIGDLVWVLVGNAGGDVISSFGDSGPGGGNTWTLAQAQITGQTQRVSLYYSVITQAMAGESFNVTFGATTGQKFLIAKGLTGVQAVDKAPAAAGGTSTSPASNATGTLSQANELVVAGVQNAAATFSAPSFGTALTVTNGGSLSEVDEFVSATTTQTLTATLSASVIWSAVIASFKLVPASITTGSLPSGPVSTSYSQQLASNGVPAFSYTLQSGTLPGTCTLSSAGLISGTLPASAGLFSFVVLVTDAAGQTATKSLSIAVTGTPYLVCQGTGTGASLAVTVATANTAGDCLAAFVVSGNATITGVSDPVNGNWFPISQVGVQSTGLKGQWWGFPAAAALTTSQAVTAAFAGTGGLKFMQVFGIPGCSAAPFDVQPAPATGSTTTPTAASGTLNYGNEIVLAGLANVSAGGSPTWSAPFTQLGTPQHTSGNPYVASAYDAAPSNASVVATATITSALWLVVMCSLSPAGELCQDDPAGAVEALVVTTSNPVIADAAGAADVLSVAAAVPQADAAGAVETLAAGTPIVLADVGAAVDAVAASPVSTQIALADTAAAADVIAGGGSTVITFTPAASASTVTGEQAFQVLQVPQAYPPASPAFITSTMPRMYLQDLPSGQWLHRDVQDVTSPSVTWQLSAPGTFSCSLSPPRSDLLDSTGNPAIKVWQTACYLEEAGEIKFGGICTSATPQGPVLPLTFTEFSTYPNGMPYTGPNISKTGIDALDAVRNIWSWLQSQAGGNLGLVLDNTQSGTLLGKFASVSQATVLAANADPGDYDISIVPLPPTGGVQWTAKAQVQVGGETHVIGQTSLELQTNGHKINLTTPIQSLQPAGSVVGLVQPATPYTLDWWNATDCGTEITSIMAEAPFDFREIHAWADPAKSTVSHRLTFGVPRLGVRQSGLRFVEGENIAVAGQGTQDGSTFANETMGIGAGSGSGSVRAVSAVRDGRVRRMNVYTNQTVDRPDRLAVLTGKVLAAVSNPDAITSITVIDHPNARFGSFAQGDDILVQLATGWRNTAIWSRITAMQQDPQTNQMTLTLARSDSFSYIATSGSAGTI